MFKEITKNSKTIVSELIDIAELNKSDILVVGCSSSEVGGSKIGTNSSVDIAKAIFEGIYPVIQDNGLYLATQCCEHLNRAIIIERKLANQKNLEIVNVIPQPKAGGSFSYIAYNSFKDPVAVEHIKADAGIDIGGTLIGMHLKNVAVPVRLSLCKLGEANITCARTRPKFIGGSRAVYNADSSLV